MIVDSSERTTRLRVNLDRTNRRAFYDTSGRPHRERDLSWRRRRRSPLAPGVTRILSRVGAQLNVTTSSSEKVRLAEDRSAMITRLHRLSLTNVLNVNVRSALDACIFHWNSVTCRRSGQELPHKRVSRASVRAPSSRMTRVTRP